MVVWRRWLLEEVVMVVDKLVVRRREGLKGKWLKS